MLGNGHKTFATPTAVWTMGLMGGRMTGIFINNWICLYIIAIDN